jgi:predicted DNA-binding transcriptional regulator AlpA
LVWGLFVLPKTISFSLGCGTPIFLAAEVTDNPLISNRYFTLPASVENFSIFFVFFCLTSKTNSFYCQTTANENSTRTNDNKRKVSRKRGNAMAKNENLLTTEKAAAVLGMSEQTMRIWRMANKGPNFIRINRSIRYRRDDLDEFVAKRMVGGE